MVILQIGLLSLKYIYAEDVGRQLAKILRLARDLLDQQSGLEYIQTILRYAAAGTDKLSEAELKTIVLQMIEEGDRLMPTLAEQWVEQGRREGEAIGLEKGREEGLEKGREEGQREATLTLLRRYLTARFGLKPDQFEADFETLDMPSLTRLSNAAFEVETLAEFKTILTELRQQTKTKNDNQDAK